MFAKTLFEKGKTVQIREASEADFEGIWPIFREIVSAGETYAYPAEGYIDALVMYKWLRES